MGFSFNDFTSLLSIFEAIKACWSIRIFADGLVNSGGEFGRMCCCQTDDRVLSPRKVLAGFDPGCCVWIEDVTGGFVKILDRLQGLLVVY